VTCGNRYTVSLGTDKALIVIAEARYTIGVAEHEVPVLLKVAPRTVERDTLTRPEHEPVGIREM
jgi:hypothetical protein